MDVPGVSLTLELVALYYNQQARQFIFRGAEPLSGQAELDWFAQAPVRKARAIIRRQATRARNQEIKRQAIANRVAFVQAQLTEANMYNINTRYPPADNQQNVPVHQQNEQQPFAVRRPTGGTSQIASSSMHPGAFQRPNHPPLQNQSVDRRTRQNNHLFNLIRNNNLISSTLILQRPHTQSRQPLNLLQDAGCQINDSIYQRELPTTD